MNIVITGASKGIGKAIAEAFAQAGYTLLLGARGELDLYNTVAHLQTNYPTCEVHAQTVDVSNKQQVQAFANWCLSYGTPDIVVNNAGSFVPGAIHKENDDILETLMATNVYSAYFLTKALLPAMMKQQSGSIFNICSIASLKAYSNGGSYSISKFALLGFSKNLREELMPHGIKVCAVIPGAVYTDRWSGSGVSESRIMEAADIAKMVFAAAHLSPQAVVEDIVLRPQLGDL